MKQINAFNATKWCPLAIYLGDCNWERAVGGDCKEIVYAFATTCHVMGDCIKAKTIGNEAVACAWICAWTWRELAIRLRKEG